MKDNIFQKAIEKWGVAMQVTHAMEECGELITTLNQFFFRNRISKEDVASEIADVELICMQLREIIGDELVDKVKEEKIAKFIRQIGDTKKEEKIEHKTIKGVL